MGAGPMTGHGQFRKNTEKMALFSDTRDQTITKTATFTGLSSSFHGLAFDCGWFDLQLVKLVQIGNGHCSILTFLSFRANYWLPALQVCNRSELILHWLLDCLDFLTTSRAHCK